MPTIFNVTSNTEGTGNLVLNEDLTGTLTNGANCRVSITNDRDFGAVSDEFEVGYATYINTNEFIRDNITDSSSNGALVDFTVGLKSIVGVEIEEALDQDHDIDGGNF